MHALTKEVRFLLEIKIASVDGQSLKKSPSLSFPITLVIFNNSNGSITMQKT